MLNFKQTHMKKIILIALVAMGFTTAQAQQSEKGTIEVLPHVGFTISDFSGSDANDNGALSSLNLGIGADFYLNDRWSIRSGLNYETMGSDFNDTTVGLSYLTIPINANYHFGKTRKWNLNFGPSIGFLTYAKAGDLSVKNAYNSVQAGVNLGIGYKFELTKKLGLMVDYQSMAGLTDTSKYLNLKNNYGSLNVGLVFKL